MTLRPSISRFFIALLLLSSAGIVAGRASTSAAPPKPAAPGTGSVVSPWAGHDTLKEPLLGIKAVYKKGSMRIRFATGQTAVWELIRKGGVLLYRQKSTEPQPTILNNGKPITVWKEERWKARSKEWPTASRMATLLRDNPRQRDSLTPYAYHDLQQNKLTALLLLAEFHYPSAAGLALAFTDTTIAPDEMYRYTICVIDPISNDTLSAETLMSTEFEETLIPVTGLTATGRPGYIGLTWKRTPAHSGFFIERQDTAGGAFRRITKQPLVFAQNLPGADLHSDSVAIGKHYAYRIVGTDAFNRESRILDTVSAIALPKSSPYPPTTLTWKAEPAGIRISWKNPPVTPAIAGYILFRSSQSGDGYAPVHNKLIGRDVTSYLDSITLPGTYFYRMVTVDPAGTPGTFSLRAMAILEDTTPPAPPRDVRITADTLGRITLVWQRGNEPDLKGYRVYRQVTGGANPEFVPITPSVMSDTALVDPVLKTVRDHFVYRIKAVDRAGNYSTPSSNSVIRLPDIIAPVKPVVTDYSVKDRGVRIEFLSPSRDVALYKILRTALSEKAPPVTYTTPRTKFIDSSAAHGIMYEYTITAADSTGNVSERSQPLRVKPFWSMELKKPPTPTAKLLPGTTADSVLVEWVFPSKEPWSAVVFEFSEGAWAQKSPLVTKNRFVVRPPQGGTYRYAVKYYFPEQGSTLRSDDVTVTVGK